MRERVEKRLNVAKLNVKTFHSLGLAILSQVEGKVPSIHDMTSDDNLKVKFIDNEIQRLLSTEKYKCWIKRFVSTINLIKLILFDNT